MKKLLTIAFLAILFSSCEKELTNNDSNISTLNEVENTVIMINASGEANIVQIADEIISPSKTGSLSTRSNDNSDHTHGDFGPNTPGISGVFSGTQNNGGTHGSATITLGNKTYTLETECVMVEGNEAVYGGLITEMNAPNPPFLPNVGDLLYFKVIDNGQGNNAPLDQFHGFVRSSKTGSKCDIWTPGSSAWPDTFYGIPLIGDIQAPGSAKVN